MSITHPNPTMSLLYFALLFAAATPVIAASRICSEPSEVELNASSKRELHALKCEISITLLQLRAEERLLIQKAKKGSADTQAAVDKKSAALGKAIESTRCQLVGMLVEDAGKQRFGGLPACTKMAPSVSRH